MVQPRLFRSGDLTFEDFVDIIPDGQKADLLDGVIYLASPENTDAADLLVWLTTVIGGFVQARDLGKVFVSRVAYRLDKKRSPEPDLGFLPKAREAKLRRGHIEGPPALAIEIVSPDSVARDYVQKRAIYEQAGVGEYWILDPDEQKATFLRLRSGRYKEIAPAKHMISSRIIPGLSLDVRWLLSSERPSAYGVLSDLLRAGNRA